MRTHAIHVITLLAAIGLTLALAGCGGSTEQEAEPAGETTESAAMETQAAGELVTLAGTSGCGHCDHGIGTACAMALETADGKVYVVDGIDEASGAFVHRMEGKPIEVKGTVTEVEGVAHVAMLSYDMDE